MKRLTFFVLLLLFSACAEVQEEEPMPLAEGRFELSLTANLPEMPQVEGIDETSDTKAIAQYTVRIQWKAGDKISVVNLTTGKILGGYLSANSAGTSTSFSGTLSGTVKAGDKIAYFYPAQDNAEEIVFAGIHVDLSGQKGTLNDVPLCVCAITEASESAFQNVQISFSYLMCYMMIAMSDIPANAKVESVRLTNVTKSFDLQINGAHIGFDSTPTRGDIVLTPGNQANSAGARTVYMAIPASAQETSRSLILETETTSFEAPFGNSAINNGKAYNTNVAGFLVDDLIFKDAVLQAWSISHFDANGDGKLSMVEIAGIKAFPEAIPSDILCFDELAYFYGLTTLPSFANQTKMTSIAIPKQITAIPSGMFSGCSALTEISMMPLTPPSLGADALSGTPDNQIIIVNDEVVDVYQSAPGWSAYASRFQGRSNVNGSNVRITIEGGEMGSENVKVNVD